ncbi:MAG: S8 family serine peptidase [Paludibacter sp.]|nr:S8 family serine peptidase [Paludibacter sp.]
MNHPDLQNNVYGTGYDAETGTTPSIVRGNHGTPCAGIVGAQQNNSIRVSGVAPSTSLMSVSLDLSWFDTPQQIANGFNWAWQNGADVISNSWGGYNPSTIIEDAINNTLTNGRSGKGTVVVFAAGNENDTYIRYPGNSIPAILVVGAASPCGERKNPASCDGETWWGSCYGTQLDIVAPGVLIPTTDRQSSNGYNTSSGTAGDYVQTFNGTSSACPHVAGLAALILSRDPTLTVQQVNDIIESTAQKVGGYNYQTTSGRPNGTWNNEMGYGLIDAYAAVAAVCLTTFFEYQTVIANTNVSGCKVSIQDVSVTNNAMLTITSERETVINSIDVQLGSELEVN